ncbi:HpcH/HpaI aldolase family protein [Subtercola sp. YIM 133946]|uniref:HpcH/HpaI aldolase family protein n=1 Tax=Subtercola sp. YIM 133946 TaxID=3118909 RepID=UPI002F941A24
MGWTLRPQAVGVWVKIPAVEVVEVLAAAGVDFVVIDREHGAIDLHTMTTQLAVARALGLPAFVRVPAAVLAEVQPALDAGASGVFLPHIDDAAIARAAVDVCRFPPVGHRHGSPTTRAGDWGSIGMAELVRRGNEQVMVVAQIETPQAVTNIDDIAGVGGLDALFIGPFDLSLSSGRSVDHPDFIAMVSRVEDSARMKIPLGGAAHGHDAARRLEARGYDFTMIGADTTLLGDSARVPSAGRQS